MKLRHLLLFTLMAGCGGKSQLSKCDRLQIWHDVHVAATVSTQMSAIIKHETGRDEYDSIYLEKLAPTMKRYGLDRSELYSVFQSEGGWPYDPPIGR